MSGEDSKQWLFRLFNSSHFDTWLCVSYLIRHSGAGIQYYLCTKLRTRRLQQCLPHLCSLLVTSIKDDEFSFALYDLLKSAGYIAYLHLKSEKLESSVLDSLCQEIIDSYSVSSFFTLRSKLRNHLPIDYAYYKKFLSAYHPYSKTHIDFTMESHNTCSNYSDNHLDVQKAGHIKSFYNAENSLHPTKSTKSGQFKDFENLCDCLSFPNTLNRIPLVTSIFQNNAKNSLTCENQLASYNAGSSEDNFLMNRDTKNSSDGMNANISNSTPSAKIHENEENLTLLRNIADRKYRNADNKGCTECLHKVTTGFSTTNSNEAGDVGPERLCMQKMDCIDKEINLHNSIDDFQDIKTVKEYKKYDTPGDFEFFKHYSSISHVFQCNVGKTVTIEGIFAYFTRSVASIFLDVTALNRYESIFYIPIEKNSVYDSINEDYENSTSTLSIFSGAKTPSSFNSYDTSTPFGTDYSKKSLTTASQGFRNCKTPLSAYENNNSCLDMQKLQISSIDSACSTKTGQISNVSITSTKNSKKSSEGIKHPCDDLILMNNNNDYSNTMSDGSKHLNMSKNNCNKGLEIKNQKNIDVDSDIDKSDQNTEINGVKTNYTRVDSSDIDFFSTKTCSSKLSNVSSDNDQENQVYTQDIASKSASVGVDDASINKKKAKYRMKFIFSKLYQSKKISKQDDVTFEPGMQSDATKEHKNAPKSGKDRQGTSNEGDRCEEALERLSKGCEIDYESVKDQNPHANYYSGTSIASLQKPVPDECVKDLSGEFAQNNCSDLLHSNDSLCPDKESLGVINLELISPNQEKQRENDILRYIYNVSYPCCPTDPKQLQKKKIYKNRLSFPQVRKSKAISTLKFSSKDKIASVDCISEKDFEITQNEFSFIENKNLPTEETESNHINHDNLSVSLHHDKCCEKDSLELEKKDIYGDKVVIVSENAREQDKHDNSLIDQSSFCSKNVKGNVESYQKSDFCREYNHCSCQGLQEQFTHSSVLFSSKVVQSHDGYNPRMDSEIFGCTRNCSTHDYDVNSKNFTDLEAIECHENSSKCTKCIFNIENMRLTNYALYNELQISEKLRTKLFFEGTLLTAHCNKIIPTLRFLEELASICERLKNLPKQIRKQGLDIEIEMLNYNISNALIPIKIPFSDHSILNIVKTYSTVLDSAENAPFLIFFELASISSYEALLLYLENRQSQSYQKNAKQFAKKPNSPTSQCNKNKNSESNVANITYLAAEPNASQQNNQILSKVLLESSQNRKKNKAVHNCSFDVDSTFSKPENLLVDANHDLAGLKDLQNDRLADSLYANPQMVESDRHSCNNDTPYFSKFDFHCTRMTEPSLTDQDSESYKHKNDDPPKVNFKTTALLLHQFLSLKSDPNLPHAEISSIKERIICALASQTPETCKNDDQESSKMHVWHLKINSIANNSKYRNLPGYHVKAAIVKRGHDLNQEILAQQLLNEVKMIFIESNLNIFLTTYKICLINSKCGIVECIEAVESIHHIKKKSSLAAYYKNTLTQFVEYETAIDNFMRSLVGYSLFTYLLQIKDRHNGNILIKENGEIVHVDFGFILGNHPGFYNVERAPFKMSPEYVDLLGNRFDSFKSLFLEGFMTLRKNSDRLCRIIEITSYKDYQSRRCASLFKERLKLDMGDGEVEKYVETLVNWSLSSFGTGLYDSYQYFSHGYMK